MENKIFEESHLKFKEFLKVKQLMERTVNEYLRYLKVFGSESESFNKDFVFKFITKHNNIVARSFIKSYIEFLDSDIKIPKQTGRNSSKKDIVKFLTREEINKLNDELLKLDCIKRNTLMLALSFQGGLRRNELFKLTPGSFRFKEWKENPDEPLDIIVFGKRNKKRIVNVTSDIAHKLKDYIDELQGIIELEKDASIFYSSTTGKPLSSKRWEDILELIGKRALDKKVSPHMLRHSCAMYLKDQLGWSIEKIAKYFGHESIQTTMIYARTTDLEIKKSFKEGF